MTANILSCTQNYLGSNVFHNKDFLNQARNWDGKKIAVIGGGQSGAEIINYIISQPQNLPLELTWVTRRKHLAPLDDSSFTNDLFTPDYNNYFFQLSNEKKASLLHDQVLASDGISLSLLDGIYQQLYQLEFLEHKGRFFKLISNHQLTEMSYQKEMRHLTLEEHQSSKRHIISADIIILCTGYKWEYPTYLSSLKDKIPLKNGRFCVNKDYSIEWDGPDHNRIYVQNAARHSHGVADPNLCLMAWRSAKIINSMSEELIYDLEHENSTLEISDMLSMNQGDQNYASIV